MMLPLSFTRSRALGVLLALATFPAAAAAADNTTARYQVTVRQVEGYDSVPAHMTCAVNKLCRGVMSVAATGGHLRVLVTAVIDGGNGYFGFRTDERDLSCSRGQEFLHLALAPPPMAAHGYAFVCDARPALSGMVQDEAGRPVAPPIRPPLVLRIDLRSEDGR